MSPAGTRPHRLMSPSRRPPRPRAAADRVRDRADPRRTAAPRPCRSSCPRCRARLSEMPLVSNVTAFPTSPRTISSPASGGCSGAYSAVPGCGSLCRPRRAPIASSASRSGRDIGAEVLEVAAISALACGASPPGRSSSAARSARSRAGSPRPRNRRRSRIAAFRAPSPPTSTKPGDVVRGFEFQRLPGCSHQDEPCRPREPALSCGRSGRSPAATRPRPPVPRSRPRTAAAGRRASASTSISSPSPLTAMLLPSTWRRVAASSGQKPSSWRKSAKLPAGGRSRRRRQPRRPRRRWSGPTRARRSIARRCRSEESG